MGSYWFDILERSGATPADLILFSLGWLVVIVLLIVIKMLLKVKGEYQLLNSLLLVHAHILLMKWGIQTVDIHRSKEFSLHQPLNDIEKVLPGND